MKRMSGFSFKSKKATNKKWNPRNKGTSLRRRRDVGVGVGETRPDDDGDGAGRFEDDLAGRRQQRRDAGRRLETEAPHQRRQDDFEFEQAVLLADAVARSGAERQEGERVPAGAVGRKKTFRPELRRIRVDVGAVVHPVDQQRHRSPGRQQVLACIVHQFLLNSHAGTVLPCSAFPCSRRSLTRICSITIQSSRVKNIYNNTLINEDQQY